MQAASLSFGLYLLHYLCYLRLSQRQVIAVIQLLVQVHNLQFFLGKQSLIDELPQLFFNWIANMNSKPKFVKFRQIIETSMNEIRVVFVCSLHQR